ncbi:MAG TPA: hypothetical protein VIN39_05555 [Candidatus Dormibacteraeota bacterium]
MAVFGPGWVFVINALTFLVSALTLALLRLPRRLMPDAHTLCGTLPSPPFLSSVPSRPLVVANLALTLAALQLLALVPPFPVLVIAASCVVGFGGLSFLNEVWEATMQQLIPADVMSRVSSYDWVISLIAMPAGFAVAGPATAQFGTRPTLVTAAVILTVPSLLVVAIPGVRRVRRTAEGTIAEGGSTMRTAGAL